MKFSTAMLFGLALIVGVAIGYMFNPAVEESTTSSAKQEKPKGAIRDGGEAATVKALRARIAELEALLEKSGKGIEIALKEKTEEKDAAKQERRGPFGGRSPKEWMEDMKKNHPEQFAQMTNGMARMRRHRQERAQRKANFLASVDTSRMSASAKKTHNELQELMAKREELEQKMHEMHDADNMPTEDEMREFGQTMHELDRQIRELNSQERDNLMVETAKNLGFSDGDAGEIAEAFQEIMENTDGGRGPRDRGPGGSEGGAQGGNSAPPPPGM